MVIKLGSLGDVLQADGALRDIRAAFPEAEIVALTMPAYRKLMERSPFVDRVLLDPRKPRWRLDAMADLRGQLRRERFDLVIDLQGQSRTNSYFRWFLSDVPWSGTAPGCRYYDARPNPRELPSLERMAGQLAQMGIETWHAKNPDVDWMAEPIDDVIEEAGLTSP
ncbi:MAG: hypothetical protein AAGF58_16165, partial [Pseudomonadota bacterium]